MKLFQSVHPIPNVACMQPTRWYHQAFIMARSQATKCPEAAPVLHQETGLCTRFCSKTGLYVPNVYVVKTGSRKYASFWRFLTSFGKKIYSEKFYVSTWNPGTPLCFHVKSGDPPCVSTWNPGTLKSFSAKTGYAVNRVSLHKHWVHNPVWRNCIPRAVLGPKTACGTQFL